MELNNIKSKPKIKENWITKSWMEFPVYGFPSLPFFTFSIPLFLYWWARTQASW